MSLHIGDKAPNFVIDTSQGEINFHDWADGSWVFFFSHPADFTPVCTTEMGRTSQLSHEFEVRNTKPLGLSTDSVRDHIRWIEDVNDTQKTILMFPIIADVDLKVSKAFDMIHPKQSNTEAVRSVFVIDPGQIIRLVMTYPMNVGRNFDEILRVIDALQLADKHSIATPADWRPGEKVIIPPSIKNDEAAGLFPQGWDEVRPYLRLTTVG